MSSMALLSVLAGSASSARGYEEGPVGDAGTLAGVVRFAGTPPKPARLSVAKHPDVCGEPKESESLVLGADRGVKDAVVRIEGVARGKKNTGERVLDNSRCVFVPHVLAAMAGSRVRVRSSDPVVHQTRGVSGQETVFNLALPGRGQEVDITRRLAKPGVVRVTCEVHPHMSAWLVVHDSPYIATTDERGLFRIDGIPPGAYTVTLWHEGFPRRRAGADGRARYEEPRTATQAVTIDRGAMTTVEFELR